MTATATEPPVITRLRIGHALLDHLGSVAGVRVLHIKGAALDASLVEGRHASTDCDVIVHPGDVPAYEAALQAHGWELRTRFEHGSVFGHAATYYHPVWGTVDLHRSFPGLDADPGATFDAWWDHSIVRSIGGRDVHVLSLIDQRALLLMHAARATSPRTTHDFKTVWTEVSEAERTELEQRILQLGGRTPFMIATDDGDGSRIAQVEGTPGFHLWMSVSQGANPTEIWRAQIQDARTWREKAGIAWKALHVNRDHLAIELDHKPTRADVRREWVNRLGRGGRRLAALARRARDSRASR